MSEKNIFRLLVIGTFQSVRKAKFGQGSNKVMYPEPIYHILAITPIFNLAGKLPKKSLPAKTAESRQEGRIFAAKQVEPISKMSFGLPPLAGLVPRFPAPLQNSAPPRVSRQSL
jgi:hypothetical protein